MKWKDVRHNTDSITAHASHYGIFGAIVKDVVFPHSDIYKHKLDLPV